MVFGLFKKKKEEVKPTNEKYLTVTIKEIKKETADAVSVYFDVPADKFIYLPGQFITIIQTIGGKKVRRAYSLCTTPGYDAFPAVTVKRVASGLMSNHVNDHFKVGDRIEIMEPMGQFTTDYNTIAERHLVLFGGGSGITPLISILKATLINEPKSKVSLVYANESAKDVIFDQQLKTLEGKYADRLKVVHVLNKPETGWQGYTGWLNPTMIVEILESLPKMDQQATVYFTCGPAQMMEIVENTLKTLGVPRANFKMESFVAGRTSPSDVASEVQVAEADAINVAVILDGNEHKFDVPAKKTILEAGLELNIDLPYSCQSGLCTACRGKLLSGKVRMAEYDGLSQSELDEGYVLCCQAHPETDDVVIEIG